VFNALEEPIDVLKHELLYVVNYEGRRIRFYSDVDRFPRTLARVSNAGKADSQILRDNEAALPAYMVESPSYTTADETDPKTAFAHSAASCFVYQILELSQQKRKSLLQAYFTDRKSSILR
jgi:prolycopene isomerase